MKPRIIFVERRSSDSVSIQRVFRQVAKDLPADEFDIGFQQVPYSNGIGAIIKNLLFFRPEPADLYHMTGDVHYITLRLPRDKTVLTIHDLVFLRRRTGIRKWFIRQLFLKLPLRRAARITTVSHATNVEIVRESSVSLASVTVIENPLLDGFTAENERVFNSECPIILQIGTAPNKNLATVAAALKDVRCRLRIIGRLDSTKEKLLEQNNIDYKSISELDEIAIVEEYRNADIVLFCSTYEGFGLPIIEAQAMRRPVVTSDLAPMNWVAGKGAVLVDPNDPASIREGVESIIRDPDLRRGVIDAGTENIRRFDAKAIAAKYAALYRELLGEG